MSKIIEKFTYGIEDKNGNIINVSARIEKSGNLYYWYTSHWTKPQDAEKIGLYHPSNTEPTLGNAKVFLKSYINMMKRSKVIVYNESY